jgi:small subunit ribosomal protein S13
MLVVFGVNFSKKKKVIYALPDLYGIGLASDKRTCAELGLSPQLKIGDLTEEQQFAIAKKVKEDFILEGILREQIKSNIQRYISNGSIRGFRHKNRLPVRGQRTQSNAKTARRVIMGIALKLKK